MLTYTYTLLYSDTKRRQYWRLAGLDFMYNETHGDVAVMSGKLRSRNVGLKSCQKKKIFELHFPKRPIIIIQR
jgi:hypothetical protein